MGHWQYLCSTLTRKQKNALQARARREQRTVNASQSITPKDNNDANNNNKHHPPKRKPPKSSAQSQQHQSQTYRTEKKPQLMQCDNLYICI